MVVKKDGTNAPDRPRRHRAPRSAGDPAAGKGRLRHPDPGRSVGAELPGGFAPSVVRGAQTARAEGPGDVAARRQHAGTRRARQAFLQDQAVGPQGAPRVARDVPQSLAGLQSVCWIAHDSRNTRTTRPVGERSSPRRALAFAADSPRDRESIVGDLLERCRTRGLGGARRDLWLLGECGSIAAGLRSRVRGPAGAAARQRARRGLALDGTRAFRGGHPVASSSAPSSSAVPLPTSSSTSSAGSSLLRRRYSFHGRRCGTKFTKITNITKTLWTCDLCVLVPQPWPSQQLRELIPRTRPAPPSIR